jgi:probable aminopeptidase NPEPL1
VPARLAFVADPSQLQGADAVVFVGRAARLLEPRVRQLVPPTVGDAVFAQMVAKSDAGDAGRLVSTWTATTPSRVHAVVLPEPCSRHNAPSRAGVVPGLLGGAIHKGNVAVVAALDDERHAPAMAMAIARSLPTFQATHAPAVDREVRVSFVADGRVLPAHPGWSTLVEAVRFAAHLVDEPPDRLGCDALVAHARAVAESCGASCTVIRGTELRDLGFGGLWGVGKTAEQPPALVCLDHPGAGGVTRGWVGKGIVYDTGGLSLKQKTSMPGMKTDMAGAAAVLAAFKAAVQLGARDRLLAVLCVAENAVGPGALRPDDVITQFSGRTVEINNTDAEGRLVLADGLSWLARTHAPDEIVDLATLTGAQSIATGKRHAAVYANDEALEQRLVAAGLHSGDLVFPVPYAPELFRAEFRSPVADMRNSVKDRNNAQPSCAGQYLGNHLAAVGFDRPWAHVDMAAPAVSNHRGTGYGVGLLLASAGLV